MDLGPVQEVPVLIICQESGFLLLARMMGHLAFVLL